jgi:hypothetical protein
MVLTGRPAMVAATNVVVQNDVLTLDVASHKLTALGKSKLWGTAPAVATTTLRPPKNKADKIMRDPL